MPPFQVSDNKLITKDFSSNEPLIKPPSPKQQSLGTILALLIIITMIVVGALYAWGKRIAEQNALIEQGKAETQTY